MEGRPTRWGPQAGQVSVDVYSTLPADESLPPWSLAARIHLPKALRHPGIGPEAHRQQPTVQPGKMVALA
ncbi:hypothetical protein NDU88_005406 [Pleurodeles waltl]|uniref:Uncharacterized protein n=1 Tax=Pleurodeles waltl TaxID=8319 RepID=A0AAV7NNY1_PLEWA|nr:hypothetical protein NDU88_005406 [Pleurodeles waltl]